MMYTNLADEIRKVVARLGMDWVVVEEYPGWKTRGSSTFTPKAIINHHDASSTTANRETISRLHYEGRSDLPGPICHVDISRVVGGKVYIKVIAAGRANHAGTGSIHGVSGNSNLFGIENMNNGVGEPWPLKQLDAICAVDIAMLNLIGKDAEVMWSVDHKEYAGARKIDRSLNPADERARLQHWINVYNAGGPKAEPETPPETYKEMPDMFVFFRPISNQPDPAPVREGIYVANTNTGMSYHVPTPDFFADFTRILSEQGQKWIDVGVKGNDWFSVFPYQHRVAPLA